MKLLINTTTTRLAANPPIRTWLRWSGLILGAWGLVGLLLGTRWYVEQRQHGVALAWSSAVMDWEACALAWALLTPLVIYVTRRFPLRGPLWARHLGIQCLSCLIFFCVEWLVSDFFRGWWFQGKFLRPTLAHAFDWLALLEMPPGVLLYAAAVGCIERFDRLALRRANELKMARLETQKQQLEANLSQAQLRALRMQLNPHFLFNALNSVSVLIDENPAAATLMLARVGSLLRTALERKEEEVTVAVELDFVRAYLEIEAIRFGGRLEVKIESDPAVLQARVPTFVLQPLVENAIKHGVARHRGPGKVEVRTVRRGDDLVLEVNDNGAGSTKDEPAAVSGIGLATTRARLEQLYPKRHRFDLEQNSACGMTATITLPYGLATAIP